MVKSGITIYKRLEWGLSCLELTYSLQRIHLDNGSTYEVCLKSKCTDFLFKCLLDSPEITSDFLQSMTLGKLHNGSNIFSTDHSNTGSHFL